jgi:DNA-binding NarL/FixJ family response regulator
MRSTFESEFHDQIASRRTQSLRDVETLMAAPRIVLADDHEEMLRIIALVLGNEFNIIGTAENGMRAVELTTTLSPDVLVLDISMPVVNGIEAASRLRALGSRARVVFLTVNTDPDFVEAARSAGAVGYVRKESLALNLAPAIRAAIEGNSFTSRPCKSNEADILY